MKKITFILAVVAAMVSLASCNKEVADPAAAENGITATFTVNLPEQTATKAISDGAGANQLLFFAYDAAGNHLDLDQTVEVSGYKATVSVNLVGGITYQFVFWAQKAGQYTAKFSSDKKTLTLNPTEMMNSDNWDAFYYKMTKDVESSFSETVTLTRPFAQLNLGAPVELNGNNERTGGDFWSANKSGIKIDNTLQTSYKIKANNVLSLLDGTASGDTEYTLTAASHPAEFLTVGGVKYDYAAMAYFLANTTKSDLTDLEITLKTKQGDTPVELKRTVHNVPLQRNYRTNVLGNVFTLEANFNIVVDADFTKDDNGNVVDHLPEYADIAALNAAFAKNPAEDAEKWSYKVKVLSAGDTKTIVLPKTLDPVDIHFAQGAFVGETITIAYAEGAEAGDKPVKLTIEAPDPDVTDDVPSIYKLIGNLPATTVVLDGTTVVNTADFHTASSTLHLMPKAKIINKLTVYAGSLLVEGFIETAVIDPSVAVNTVDAVAKVAEDGEVVRFIVQNLNAVIEEGAKVGELVVSTTSDYEGAAPVVTIEGGAKVETVEQKGDAKVVIDDDADVDTVEAEKPSNITGEGAEDVDFLIKNEGQLTAAIEAKVTKMKIGADFTCSNPHELDFATDIDLNNYTITFEFAEQGSALLFTCQDEDSEVYIHGGTLVGKDFVHRVVNYSGKGYLTMKDVVASNEYKNSKSVYAESGYVEIDNVDVTATGGGGIYLWCSAGIVKNCDIVQSPDEVSSPWHKSALAISDGCEIEVENCTLEGNVPFFIFTSGGTAILKNTSFNGIGGAYGSFDVVVESDQNVIPSIAYLYSNCVFSKEDPVRMIAEASPYAMHVYYVDAADEALWIHNEEELHYALEVQWPLLRVANDFSVAASQSVIASTRLDLNGKTISNNVQGDRLFNIDAPGQYAEPAQFEVYGNGKLIIPDTNKRSFGFVRLRAPSQNVNLHNITLEGITCSASFVKCLTYYQSVEIKDCVINITPGDGQTYSGNVHGRVAIVDDNSGYGSYNSLSIKDTEINNNNTDITETYSILSAPHTPCTFENVSYSAPYMSTGFYTGNSTYTNCEIVTKTEGNNVPSYPWLATALATSYGRTITIDSGRYVGYRAVYIFSSGGVFNISGGEFEGSDAVVNIDNNTWESGYSGASVVNISGGTFRGPLKSTAWGGSNTNPEASLIISGGTFTAPAGTLLSGLAPNQTTLITGGTFSEDPSDFVASGYQAVDNGNGTWTVTAQ